MLDSVRTRLTLWYVGLLALAMLAFSSGLYLLFEHNLHRRLDDGLQDSISAIVRILPLELDEGESIRQAAVSAVEEPYFPNQAVAIFDAAGNPLSAKTAPNETPVQLPGPPSEITEQIRFDTVPAKASDDQNGRRVAALRVAIASHGVTYLVAAGRSTDSVAADLKLLRNILALVVPLALALIGAGGWMLARESLAPVVAMSERARRIGGENLNERLPVANPRDELGRLAATFNEMLERLDASFDRQRQFMADASHELRTPLHVIRTATEVTLEKPRRDEIEYREALETIGAQVRRLTRIVEDMFTLARADTGRWTLERTDFYLDELLAETARAADVLASRKGVRVETDLAPESVWRGDEGLLRQMMLNLLDNAIKYTPPRGIVHLNLARRTSSYEIAVADTGPGIAAEAQPKIFDRFYRADQARSRTEQANGGGAGLGLSIARWIAEAHDGRLELRDSGPRGSTFVASLPLARD